MIFANPLSSCPVGSICLSTPDSSNHVFESSDRAISFLLRTRSISYTLPETRQLHAVIVKSGFRSSLGPFNYLIHLYAVNGNLDDAQRLFDGIPRRDVVSWTTLIDGYAKLSKMDTAQKLFDEMPDRNVVSWNVLVSGYARCRDIKNAEILFGEMPERDIVSYNSLISAYSRNGLSEEAFAMFQKLLLDGFMPNKVSLLSVLPAISDLGQAFRARCLHTVIHKIGVDMDGVVCSAVINTYSKCDCLDIAFQVFERYPRHNVASWNPMLAGLIQNDHFVEALELFKMMQLGNIRPDYVTLVIILPMIAYLGAIGTGKWIHTYIVRNKITINATLGSALIDMYSKCGSIHIAIQLFNIIDDKTSELYNSMIAGMGVHGMGRDALKLFSQMEDMNLKVDDISLVAVLNACSHSGLVSEGLDIFTNMDSKYKITPNIQHFGCVVDLLGRAGLLEQAKQLIKDMPIEPDIVIWKSILGTCKTHGNVEIAKLATRNLIELNPNDSSSYVLMSNIYDAAGQLENAVMMRKMLNDGGIRKEPGYSSIEVAGEVHEFLVGDRSHQRVEEIYAMLDEMVDKLKAVGYLPNTKLVLIDIEEEGKQVALHHHSERLAIAFGLLNSSHGEPLHIVKNLRICSDCHNFIKLLSEVYDREIIVRDQRRFHHFRHGICSCMDYW